MVEAFPESKRISAGKKFVSAFVRVTAPSASYSTGVDIVVVVDTSAGMTMGMLQNVKNSLIAIVNKLGYKDRFSVVSSAGSQPRYTPLREMTETSKEAARSELRNLVAGGESGMVPTLQRATEVRYYKLI
jgi:Mg-chelatase subunit ChlD